LEEEAAETSSSSLSLYAAGARRGMMVVATAGAEL
jgi:hypothetical protein